MNLFVEKRMKEKNNWIHGKKSIIERKKNKEKKIITFMKNVKLYVQKKERKKSFHSRKK